MGVPTRFPDGATNVDPGVTLNSYLAMDPSRVHAWWSDFDGFTAGDWTVTETQAGATQAITNADGGILALVNSAADNDLNSIQWAKETFLLATAKKFWIKTRFKISDATLSDLVIGLQITDATPLAVTDGVYFRKAEGSTTLNLVVCKNSTETVTAAGTLVADTYVVVGAVYLPEKGVIDIYFNDVRVASSAITNMVDDEELTVTIAVQNGEAVAKTLSTDYFLAAKER